jgi:hypothetical protein
MVYKKYKNIKLASSVEKTSFIQLHISDIYINNVRQWYLYNLNKLFRKLIKDLDTQKINEQIKLHIASKVWNTNTKSANLLNNINNLEIPLELNLNNFVNRNTNVTNINHVLIESNFIFYNNLWINNTAYIKINDDLYWSENHNWNTTESCRMDKWNNPIRIIIPYHNEKVIFKFGLNFENNLNNILNCDNILDVVNKDYVAKFEHLRISIK